MNSAPFSQAVIWPGATCPASSESDFVDFIAEQFNGARAQFIGCFLTKPDIGDGCPVPGTGGRSDLVFAIHEDDMGKFAAQRFGYGMRWVDDVLANETDRGDVSIYVREIHDLKSWTEPTTVEVDEYREDGSETSYVGD